MMGYSRHREHVAIAKLSTKMFRTAVRNMGIDAQTRWIPERLPDQRRP